MPRYEVRNRRSKMVLGEVVVERPAEVLDALLDVTGTTIGDLAQSLGKTMGEIKEALDIVELAPVELFAEKKRASRPLSKAVTRQRSLYVTEDRA